MSIAHSRSRRLRPLVVAVIVLALAGLSDGGASATPAARSAAPRHVTPDAGFTPPVPFTRNEGQAPAGVRYVGAAPGLDVAFTDTGVAIDLTRSQPHRKPTEEKLTLRFRDAAAHPRVTGAAPAPGVVNDFHGADPSRWRTGIPTFGQVVYHDLWPGIDALFTVKNGTLKYSFTLAPGADPDDIRLSYGGADKVAVGRGGDLSITAGTTVLHDQAPVSHEDAAGAERPVATAYRLLGGTDFGFTLARHGTGPLTVDPGLDYSSYLNGGDGGASSTWSLGNDAAGNVYVFGQTDSASFPTTDGAYQGSLDPGGTGVDMIVTKLDPTGRLVYSTYVGGSDHDAYADGRVAADGTVVVVGDTTSTDFPVSSDAYRRTPYGAKNQSVAFELDPTGSRLEYGTYLVPDLLPLDVAIGGDGSATIVGQTSSDFDPTTPGAFQTAYPGGALSGYAMRLDAAGSGVVFATYLGSPITDQGQADPQSLLTSVAVDAAGAVYVTGQGTLGYPVTPGGLEPVNGGAEDSVLIKLDPTGRTLDYATYIADPPDLGIVSTPHLAVDGTGHAFLTAAVTPGVLQVTPDAYQAQCLGAACAAVMEYGPTGALVYSSYFGGTAQQTVPYSIATDGGGRTYITGMTQSGSDLPITPNALFTSPGDYDAHFYLAVFDKGTLLYSTYFGGTASLCLGFVCGVTAGMIDMAPNVADGTVYLAGTTSAPDFPVTSGARQDTYPGGVNSAWVARLTLPPLGAPSARRQKQQ